MSGGVAVVAEGNLEQPFLFVIPAQAGIHSSAQMLATGNLTSDD
jgi:hypothetical protein